LSDRTGQPSDEFSRLAVWSKGSQRHPYVKAVVRAVKRYRHLFTQPVVLMGDLNSNVLWDALRGAADVRHLGRPQPESVVERSGHRAPRRRVGRRAENRPNSSGMLKRGRRVDRSSWTWEMS
jgi:hypothetical protein